MAVSKGLYRTLSPRHMMNHSTSSWPRRLIIIASAVGILIFIFSGFIPDISVAVTDEVSGPMPYYLGKLDGKLKDIQNETLGFQEVFMVSVPTRFDKLDINILASSLAGFKYKPITGMLGKDVPEISLPPGFDAEWITNSIGINTIGAWRSELNAVRQIIADRLTSALILEDDMDWDVALKSQLIDAARGARFMSNQTADTAHSPYGDNWDVLWLGHCGMGISGQNRRRFVISQDPTTPPIHRLHTPAGSPDGIEWTNNGTRVVFATGWGSCSWAYAVSYKGAQKIVKGMSVDIFNSGFDNGMGGLCQSGKINCLSVYPPIFGAFTQVGDNGKVSDISTDKGQWHEKPSAHNVAYGTKQNLDVLIAGERQKTLPQWDEMPELTGPVERQYILS